jgi:thioredoxin reductase (NADPH)
MNDDTLDCLVIGGGAAGLTAAVYLGRYKRRALLVDADASRLALIPCTRNVPGFPDGIVGRELLQRLRSQADKYGVPRVGGFVDELRVLEEGFEARAGTRRWRARYVLLATGARDVEPDIPGLGPALQVGQVRYCPICDGFETQGQRVAVLGRGRHGLREALFVAGFDNEVTWLALETHEEVDPAELARLRAGGVRIAEHLPRRILCNQPGGVEVELANGQQLRFDVLYPALGLHHACELATALGARCRDDGQLFVDEHMQTSVPGLYAAGDVAVDLNQISVAAGHAAIAATAIHNQL